MTVTFSVTYEIPVSPERIAEIEAKMAHVIATVDPPDEAERQVAMLQRLMAPERRTVPARQDSGDGKNQWWYCPVPECNTLIACLSDGAVNSGQECPYCRATVNRHDLPMHLGLYRMRTGRNDGVEV